ncbi:Small GTPase superfamily, ARF type,Small GTP-binding protein domain,Small GTPase superfamily, ARF/SAR [Cinara cedri]|uniref:Small GTPase superfamily, ARF type,Small GTP-binding protein domain,Small GTPase superfamily, ARF/SAR n=1 Tax=Cinara cedri TaxID=506608 RepID=A0A5E4ME57_9HEMI|nr:Small GTPase superfamily, ARF type,Small GTP-binding protein domain,Small GTPase superfamily, ARF/SAR [Cinara cedri]
MNVWRKLMRILGIAGRTPRRRKARALFVGLNNAGKSTLLNRLKSDREQVSRKMITPTVGFTAGQFVFNNVKFAVTDMSGRDGYRALWESMYGQCDAIVFVVDSTDQMRFAVVKDELDMMLRHPDVAGRLNLPILFVATKTAAPDACGASTVATALRLHERLEPNRQWRLASTDAITTTTVGAGMPGQPVDDGLREAMEWLVDLVKVSHHRQS